MQQELSHTVYQKLQKLVKAYEGLKTENEKLQQKIEDSQTALAQKNQRIEELEAQAAVLKSSLGQMGDAEKKEVKQRISQYIKDIDKAIMLLNE